MKIITFAIIAMLSLGCATQTTWLSNYDNIWITEHSNDGSSDRIYYCLSRQSPDSKIAVPNCYEAQKMQWKQKTEKSLPESKAQQE